MHHVTIDDWSRRSSFLHARDARAKLLALLVLLFSLSITTRHTVASCSAAFVLLCFLTYSIKLPLPAVLRKSALVLPFCGMFAAASFLAGDRDGALRLLVRSYVSGFASLVFIATTPLPSLLRGLEQLRAPRLLAIVMQFLYRYLFLISEEAQHVRAAALSRGGFHGAPGFQAAAGALSVLFARSYTRAGHIHWAMLSRGYNGTLPVNEEKVIRKADVILIIASISIGALLIGAGR